MPLIWRDTDTIINQRSGYLMYFIPRGEKFVKYKRFNAFIRISLFHAVFFLSELVVLNLYFAILAQLGNQIGKFFFCCVPRFFELATSERKELLFM